VAQDLTLAADFAAPTREQWLAAVGKAIKGADYDSTLVSTTLDGIRIEPLYTADDAPGGPDAGGFPGFDPLLRGALAAPRPAGRWDVRTSLAHPDPVRANEQALADLANGATSV
jgi:methylmalonyl-CoA mutase